ncbi:hypothetical protein [Escherichia coli]|uniref:hypothetical protein n=1 Tax=Escherichia coli TaxID=562 RepID=UPI00202332DF|nr:hypothetical protein [Escherichia coli]
MSKPTSYFKIHLLSGVSGGQLIWQPEFTDKILSRKPGAVQIVTLNSRYAPNAEEKKCYQCADIVNTIIESESSVEWMINKILQDIKTAEESGFISEELLQLKSISENYLQELITLKRSTVMIQRELADKVLGSHGLMFDNPCEFNVNGYRFSATPVSQEANYIISDLFCYTEKANINMKLSDVFVSGGKKTPKNQIPGRLVINLWDTSEANVA